MTLGLVELKHMATMLVGYHVDPIGFFDAL